MTVQQFLARQRASFVSLHNLLEQMTSAMGCSLQQAASALSIVLRQAQESAPAWCVLSESWGVVEVPDENQERSMRFLGEIAEGWSERMPLALLSDVDRLLAWTDTQDGRCSLGQDFIVLGDHGFRRTEIYRSLHAYGMKLPDADADALGEAHAQDASAGRRGSIPLTLEDKREILRLRDEEVPVRKIAKKFGKSPRTIYDVLNAAEKKLASPDLTIVSRRR